MHAFCAKSLLLWAAILAFVLAASGCAQSLDEAKPTRISHYDVWQGQATVRRLVHSGTGVGQYHHAPVIEVDAAGNYVVLWNGNLGSGKEGAEGQRIFEAISSDGGLTWSAARQPFADRQFSANALPVASTQWQPVLLRVGQQLWAFWTQERSHAIGGGTFWSQRTPQGLWRNQRLCAYRQQSDPAGDASGVRWCDAAEDLPAGHAKFVVRGGQAWFLTAQQAIVDRKGRVLVAVTAMASTGDFESAAKRMAVLVSEDGGQHWTLSPFVPQGVMGEADAWEVGLAEVEAGYLAIVRRNDAGAPVGQRMAVTRSSDAMSWQALQFWGLAIHRDRPFIVNIGGDANVLLLPDHESNRRNQAAFLRRFGTVFTPALPVSNEADDEWAHYATGAYDRAHNCLLVVYSTAKKKEASVRDIVFARVDNLPPRDRPQVIPRLFGALMRKDPRQVATLDAVRHRLQLVGSASAGVELPSVRGHWLATFDLAGLRAAGEHPLVVVGTREDHLRVAVRLDAGGASAWLVSRQVAGVSRTLSVTPIIDRARPLSLRLDFADDAVRVFGTSAVATLAPYLYLGDAFAQQTTLSSADLLSVEMAGLRFEQ